MKVWLVYISEMESPYAQESIYLMPLMERSKAHFISWCHSGCCRLYNIYIMHTGLLRSAHHLIFMLFAQLRRVSNFHDAIHTQSTPRRRRCRRTTNFHFALHALFERIFALCKYFDMCMRAERAAAAAPGSLMVMGWMPISSKNWNPPPLVRSWSIKPPWLL